MAQCHFSCLLFETFLLQAIHHHVVGTRPDTTLPITAVGLVARIVSRQRRNTERTVESSFIIQLLHHSVGLFFVQYIRVQCPISTDALGLAKRTVCILVIQETGFFVPQVFADVLLQHFGFVFQFFDFLPTFQVEAHFEQQVGNEKLLQVGIQPDHVTVAENHAVFARYTRHVVHTGSPTARPIHTVSPGAVQLQPLVIRTKYRENLVQTFHVTKLVEVHHFAPRNQVRPCTYRVITFETVGSVGLDFTTDESVRMLLGVEVVQGILEREETGTVTGKHQDKGRVPHEDVSIVSRIDVRHDEARTRLRVTQIAYPDFPSTPVHVDFFFMTGPYRIREYLLGFCKGRKCHILRLLYPEFIFGYQCLLHIRILIRNLINAVIATALCMTDARTHSQTEQTCYYVTFLHHFFSFKRVAILSNIAVFSYSPVKCSAPGPKA